MTAGGEKATAAGITDREPRTPPGREDPESRRAAAAGPPAADTAPGRRPWWVWAVPFAVLFALLCVRNRFLFTPRLYEQGDGGANSILIEQAKHFTLLVGNYSRERFNHPGPAYMYVQALGEYLFQNALHLVPTARPSTSVALLAATAGVAVLAVIPGIRTSTNDIDLALPRVVSALAARAPGKTIVLHVDRPAWVETTGFLVQAERAGVRACLDDPWYTFLMTRQFICTSAQAASGQAYWFYTPRGLPPHAPVRLRFSGIAVVAASP